MALVVNVKASWAAGHMGIGLRGMFYCMGVSIKRVALK